MKMLILAVIICILSLTACSEGTENGATALQADLVQQSDDQNGDRDESVDTSVPMSEDAEENSFILRYPDIDISMEIFLKDCVCEYDRNNIQVYTCYVNDSDLETEGYVLYIQTPDDTSTLFPVKDYLADKNGENLYMLWGSDTFGGIQGVSFEGGVRRDYTILGMEYMEELIGEAYGLELSENGNDFDDMQVEFTGLFVENGNKVLGGNASAVYRTSGRGYSVEWEINVDTAQVSAKAYLSDFDIHPLYAAFLRNEICVENPFVAEDSSYSNLTFFDDKDYMTELTFLEAWKSFSLVDVNDDGAAELIFDIQDGVDELMYILGVQNDELVCYDIFETHTFRLSFGIYDNGCVWMSCDYDDGKTVYYTYTDDGKAHELIHFVKESENPEDGFGYYYLDGNESLKYRLESNEEYNDLTASYRGGEPKWHNCLTYADIPQYD